MSILSLGLTLCLLFQVITGQGDSCQEHIVKECSNYLLSTTFDFTTLVISKDSIESTCSRVDEAKKCIDDYFDNCHSQKTKEEYIQGGGALLMEACQFLRDQYIPHLDCYKPLADKYAKCTEEIPKITGDVADILKPNSTVTSTQTKQFCCGIDKIFTCVTFPTFQQCGGPASQTMELFLRRQLPPPLIKVCDEAVNNCKNTIEVDDGSDKPINHGSEKPEEKSSDHGSGKNTDPNNATPALKSLSSVILSLFLFSIFS